MGNHTPKSDGNGNVIISMQMFVIIPIVCTIVGILLSAGILWGVTTNQQNTNTKNIDKLTGHVTTLTVRLSELIGFVHAKHGEEVLHETDKSN